MSTWTEVFLAARDWLTEIWQGIFSIEIFDGLTFKVLFLGILMISFSISLYRFLVSNTHAELGTYTDTITDTSRYNVNTRQTEHYRTRTSSYTHPRRRG